MKSPDQLAAKAAKIVLKENRIKRVKGEDPVVALGFAMGEEIEYEEALLQLVGRAIELDRAQRPRTLLGDAYYERIENAIRLAFEGQGEAWSDRLSGDRLARVARDAIEEAGL